MNEYLWHIRPDDSTECESLTDENRRKVRKAAYKPGAPFVVGRSDPARDFPYVLSPPTEWRNETDIRFLLADDIAEDGVATLDLDVMDLGKGNPYAVFVYLNGHFFRQRIPELVDAQQPGTVRTITYELPAHVFRKGINTVKIRNHWGVEDLVLGCVALRVPGANLAPVTSDALKELAGQLADEEVRRSSHRAEVESRLTEWFTPAKIGLFVHWGLGTTPGFQKVEDFDAAVAAGGWTARKWVDEAKRIRAGYITLASFHSCLGFIRPWRSAIPGTPTTSRDYLGELIREAHRENIKVVVYITCGAPGDVEAYRDYARRRHPHLTEAQIESSFTLGTAFGGGAFTFDTVEELCRTYAIDGLWFDAFHNPTWYEDDAYPWAGGHEGDKANRYDATAFAAKYFHHRDMIRFVRNLNPRLVTFVNFFPPILEKADVRGHEFGDKELWKLCPPTGPMPLGEENLLIPSGDWWYHGDCPEFSFQREIKRTVHTLGCGITACVSEGPLIDGDFPGPLVEYNAFLGRFLDWAGESLLADVVPGGRGKGGFEGGEWDGGAYGVTTFNPATKVHYLHVLTAPSGTTLSLPDAGYRIVSAQDLKTGAPLPFTQSGGKLFIEVKDWRSLETDGDFIIKLAVS
jgi:hypothetical protein